jgi:hypothetical protein
MITIQYGPWTPDLSDIPFQMPDQQGPVTVPVVDCLNVYYDNGKYQSIPTPVATAIPALAAQCLSAITMIDPNGRPVPIFGASNGVAYYQSGPSSVAAIFSNFNSIPMQGWNFAQFNGYVFAQAVITNSFEANPGNLLFNVPGASAVASGVSGAYYGNVLGVVGQFLMIGDLAGIPVVQLLGTGNGILTTFTGTITGAPIYPTSILVSANLVSGADNGAGVITGTGVSGTINYETGAISVTFTTPPGGGIQVNVQNAPAYRSRLQWSPIGNPTTAWPTPLTNAALAVQSGINDLEYQYGPIMFISGYPLYGVIFQRNAITRAQYIGDNVVFSWQTYIHNQGLLAKGAAVKVSEKTYFLSDAGFLYTDGANVIPIGTAHDNSEGIDGWFFANVNKSAYSAIRSGYDAVKRNVLFAIPTGSNTLPDTLLSYNVLSGHWCRSAISTEMIWTDSDGFTDRLGIINQSHQYQLLTGTPVSTSYLESADLSFSDGLVRDTNGVRPNIDAASSTVTVGTRNILGGSITYNAGFAPDSFGAGFAPALTEGLYTRIRVSAVNASAIHGATCDMTPGGQF